MTTNDSSMIRKCLDISCSLSRAIPASGLMLFCILVHLIALHLQAIRSGIEHQMIYSRSPNEWLLQSQRWHLNFNKLKRYHLQVSKTIDDVNHYFGILLLAEVVYVFTGVTSCFMFILIAAMSGDGLLGLLNGTVACEQMMHLLLITSFSDRISNEVLVISVSFDYRI